MAAPRCRNCGGLDWTNAPGSDEHGRCVACREFPTLGYLGDRVGGRVVRDPGPRGRGPAVPGDERPVPDPAEPLARESVRGAGEREVARRVRHSRGSQVTKPQKWGKAPLSSLVGLWRRRRMGRSCSMGGTLTGSRSGVRGLRRMCR
jgi:hypothetical protein